MRPISIILLIIVLLSWYCLLSSEERPSFFKNESILDYTPDKEWLDTNRMNGVLYNNGIWFYDIERRDRGLEWPEGSDLSPIFAAGQWIAAKVDTQVRVSAVQFEFTEFQPGEINLDGTPADPNDRKYRWYRLFSDGSGDWTQWPIDQGAPVDENNQPLLLGDQTIFCIYNDLTDHEQYGGIPLGAEIRQLAWSYNAFDARGDMVFLKWQIVNKSGVEWDSAFFSIWVDADLGDALNDLFGCDTLLNMGFCYNDSENDEYDPPIPAVGVVLLQGPIIDSVGEQAMLPGGVVLQDKKMLKMTGFMSGLKGDDIRGSPHTWQHFWNYMRSRWRDGSPLTYGGYGTDPSNPPTKFMNSGDPESGTGWLPPVSYDQRLLMNSGPFTMTPWEDSNADGIPNFGEPGVQEIVAAVICKRGSSRLNSVTKLKEMTRILEIAYESNFVWEQPPIPPHVEKSELPNEIILTWDERSEYNEDGMVYESASPLIADIYGDTLQGDVVDDSTFNFYGYSVYQYSDAEGNDPFLVVHWDVGPVKDAKPYDGQRFVRIVENMNPDVGALNAPLINGKEYFYGVTAEAYLEYAEPQIIESRKNVITVKPGYTPGVRYSSSYNEEIPVEHGVTDPNRHPSDGTTKVTVIDPSKTTGLDYTVGFNDDNTWYLFNSNNDTITNNETNQSGNGAYNVYDGLLVTVFSPEPGIDTNKPGPYGDVEGNNGWDWQGERWVGYGPDWGGQTWYGSIGKPISFFGSTVRDRDYVDVELRWAGGDMSQDPSRWSKAYLYRRDQGYAYNGLGDVPFAVWDTQNNRRLNICFVEMDSVPSLNNPQNLIPANGIWDMGWHELPGDTGFASLGGNEYLFIMNSDYDPSGNAYDDINWGPGADVLYAIWAEPRAGYVYLHGQFDLQLFGSNPNTPYDRFTFTAPPAAKAERSTLKADLEKIQVVPNPYYGVHSGDFNSDDRWVQFTFLPAKCTVRIFDLHGMIIQKLEKDDPSTPFLKWNLRNLYGLPIASGIYVYHVEVPGVGEKVGKLAVFSAEFIPR